MKAILRRGRTCWRMSWAREAGLLVDGRDYYRALYQAARSARRYILMAGWQFDSEVSLLRGDDRPAEGGPVQLLPFLAELCERNPRLRVYLLAWDFNVLYTLKREFLQDWWFRWGSHYRIQFRFDSSHPVGASHHQKFVVIDGGLAFVGGLDIAEGYWDDRRHQWDNPLRVTSAGEPFVPRHDVQAYVSGWAAMRLARLFAYRWRQSGGGRLLLLPPRRRVRVSFEPSAVIASRRVAISRTFGHTVTPPQKPVTEIREMYEAAILSAEKLIYIENQYFSARAVLEALCRRMEDKRRPRLEIVMILPRQPEAFIEEIGLGTTQAKYLHALTETAARTGHALGIYNTRAGGENPARGLTFIHSKLLLVDDRFLTVGSANMANRSMGFDSELNLAWEATRRRHWPLRRSLREIRVSLLAEHCGADEGQRAELARVEGLVAYLGTLAAAPNGRLCHHRIGSSRLSEWVTALTPHQLIIDPEKAVIAERLEEMMTSDRDNLFAKGIALLNHWLYRR